MSTSVSTLTGVSVSSFACDARYQAAVQVARDYLEGYRGDYVFFAYDPDTWVVLTDFENGVIWNNGNVSADSCTCFEISVATGSAMARYNLNLQGTLIGTEEQALNARLTGDVPETGYRVSTALSTPIRVSVSNPNGYLFYSNIDNTPHLIEGGQNYAYAAFLLAIGVITFKLADRLFRRVY